MPVSRPRFVAIVFTLLGSITVVAAALLSSASGVSQLMICAGALLPVSGLIVERFVGTSASRAAIGFRTANSQPPKTTDSTAEDRQKFEAWREQVSQSLEEQSQQLEQQRSQLSDRMLRYREFLEYPTEETSDSTELPQSELSERDREVNQILEQEAARVYEKIRADGYRVDGHLDSAMIRQETLDVIQRVARVYSPDSENPLLETSFDQLARAASRVCLHALVLVERLPLDVQHYTIAELYNYVRKAVMAWGAWQTVSPWMTRLSRGLYAGRLAAGANPVTMGAWWVASELGRRGTQKLIDNYVDQTAVAFFNDAVRLVGNEVACVYGPGVRQRDPAWAYGAELTELQHRFPQSRDSLQAGLREITGLPLRSEYDRIYLYRCMAEHKPSGLRLAEPTILTRDERESIAKRLEQFFSSYIHGVKPSQVEEWQDSVEEHLDLRLSLTEDTTTSVTQASPLVALQSIQLFLTGAGGLSTSDALDALRPCSIYARLSSIEIKQFRDEALKEEVQAFAPPDLDPNDPLTQDFLDGLIGCCVRAPLFDPALETLLLETGRYFRRSPEEIQRALTDAWMEQLRTRTLPDAPLPRKAPIPARQLLQLLKPGESVAAIYHDLRIEPPLVQDGAESVVLRLVVLQQSEDRRLLLLTNAAEPEVLWQSSGDYQTERLSGIIIDDIAVSGGQWSERAAVGTIIVSGRFGTGYESWFAPML